MDQQKVIGVALVLIGIISLVHTPTGFGLSFDGNSDIIGVLEIIVGLYLLGFIHR